MRKKKHHLFYRSQKAYHKTSCLFANQAQSDLCNEYKTMIDHVSRIFYETQKNGGEARVTICIKQL